MLRGWAVAKACGYCSEDRIGRLSVDAENVESRRAGSPVCHFAPRSEMCRHSLDTGRRGFASPSAKAWLQIWTTAPNQAFQAFQSITLARQCRVGGQR